MRQLWGKAVVPDQYACGQFLRSVVRVDQYFALSNQRPSIKLFSHEMNSGAVLTITGIEGPLMGIDSGIFG